MEYENLNEKYPEDSAVVVALARCRIDLAEPDAAQQLLDELLAKHPDCAPALIERGRLALHRGEAAHAEEWLRRAVAWAPQNREACFGLHLCLQAQGKDEEDKKCLDQLHTLEIDQEGP
jgi:hypothetical protein